MDDRFWMKRALKLALKGTGKVSPNPRVGALLVKNGEILAEGYHALFGGPHAEAEALSRLQPGAAKGSTLYVNLEPCVHFGKTPPCTDELIRAGVKRVVVGATDPNPLVAGRGIHKLKQAGVEVQSGVLEGECVRLNRAFFKYITKKIPWVILKTAQTLDGKIAACSGQSRWISGETSRKHVHKMRSESDAVLVGIGTVLADDPELTVRGMRGAQPRRIILDSRLRIPLDSRLVRSSDPEKTVIATVRNAPCGKMKSLQESGVTVWILKQDAEGRVDTGALLKKAFEEGIASILIEGGNAVNTSFLKAKQVDQITLFTAPRIFGKGLDAFGDLGVLDPSDAVEFRSERWFRSGSDMVFEGVLTSCPGNRAERESMKRSV
jgi:diaminohydroxyphosphoribosylaminopyrimidine deaminase/5-amino-6-(5-phosphoribosylamino)uracil reductase